MRKFVTVDGLSDWLRPGFVAGYMTGMVDELAYSLLLAAHGVQARLLTIGFGHGDMYWYSAVERMGRSSLVGATVRDAARLPAHLAADEHHADWAGRKGYVAMTVVVGCIPGTAPTAAADDVHLREAYGAFAAEARDVDPEYAPATVDAGRVESPDHLARRQVASDGRRRQVRHDLGHRLADGGNRGDSPAAALVNLP